MTVRFRGPRRMAGAYGPGDEFVQDETIDRVVPGAGLIAVTAQVPGVNAGEWDVTAALVTSATSPALSRRGTGPARPAAWSWRHWRLSTTAPSSVRTRWEPLAVLSPRPAVVPGSWALLVATGIVLALLLQRHALSVVGLPANRGLLVSLTALLLGSVGARLWYLALNRDGAARQRGTGWCLQGFVAGVLATFAVALPVAHLPVGRFLDASAGGLLVGAAVGRLGCLLTGCCAGRITSAPLGLWLSDRRVCARRIPAQLYEAAAAAVIGVAALLLVDSRWLGPAGSLFAASLSGFVLVRQGLLGLRAEPRQTTWASKAVAAAALVAVTFSAAVMVPS